MFALLRRLPKNHVRERASSGRSGGEDQRTPPRAGGSRRRNATVSLYCSPEVYPFISMRARTHARRRRQLPYHAFMRRRVVNAQASTTIRTCIENDCRSKRHRKVRIEIPHVGSCVTPFASCSLIQE